jgi:hypothetical protein
MIQSDSECDSDKVSGKVPVKVKPQSQECPNSSAGQRCPDPRQARDARRYFVDAWPVA